MSDQLQTVTCQRCGSAFAWSSTYLNFLKRRGIHVVVPVLCPSCFLREGELSKQRGKVKWFSPRKHYGFIVTNEGEEVFFHEKQLLEQEGEAPQKGQPARFHLHYPIKGPEALNVELFEE